jgi:hypothetical protein
MITVHCSSYTARHQVYGLGTGKAHGSTSCGASQLCGMPFATQLGLLMWHFVSVVGFHGGESKGYMDSDYGGEREDRRSTTEFVMMFYGSRQSRLQPTVAISTTEAEFMAAAACTRESLCTRVLCADFGLVSLKIALLCDNQACIKNARHPMSKDKTKHIGIQHHVVRERSETR